MLMREPRKDTIAIHGGYDGDPTTHAVAVPIYQTVSYEFDSAEHGAALFNLEVEGYRYGRISNPTTEVLERRVALLEGGMAAMAVGSGQAALHYAIANLVEPGRNLVSVPQLYGTTHTLFAHFLRRQGIEVRFAASDAPAAIAALIDGDTRGVFCESVGNPAGNVADIEALAEVGARAWRAAGGRQHRRDADPAAADRARRRHRRALADEVPRRPRHDDGRRHRRFRPLRLGAPPRALPDVQRAGRILSRARLHRAFRPHRVYRALPQRLPAHHRRRAVAAQRLPAAAGHRDGGGARRAPCRECAQGRGIPAQRSPRRLGELCRLSRQPVSRAGAEISRRPGLLAAHLRPARRLRGRGAVLRRAAPGQAAGQSRRREIARLPSGLDHAPADEPGSNSARRGCCRK